MEETRVTHETIRALAELYPNGVPARLIRDPRHQIVHKPTVEFTGASAANLAVVFVEKEGSLEAGAAAKLVEKAITDGLKRSLVEVLLIRCSGVDAEAKDVVSLADCAPRVVLVAGAGPGFVTNTGEAIVIYTESIDAVLSDREAKRRFWEALQGAWGRSVSEQGGR
jgi:hypothetical protein